MNFARAAFWLALLVSAEAQAHEVYAAQPRTLHAGAPLGSAVAEAADTHRSRSAARLPAPSAAGILWRARVPGGLSGNLLVDGERRLFLTGNGQVLQFSGDGTRQFDVRAEFASALGSALGSDGTRGVLTREGHLLGFDPRGELSFDAQLHDPAEALGGQLLPSNAGGFLVTLGTWAFHLGPRGQRLARVQLSERINHLVAVEHGFVLVDARGNVHRWDGYSKNELLAGLEARVSACAARPSGTLVLLVGERRVVELPLDTGLTRNLFVEDTGLLPSLALPAGAPLLAFRRDGSRIALGDDGTLQVFPLHAPSMGHFEEVRMLAGEDGRSAWMAARVPLTLGANAETSELGDAQCSEPLEIASLGPGRLVVACRSGEIWAIGSPALARAPIRITPPSELSGHGANRHQALY